MKALTTKPFNFNLPDTLRDFMEFDCARRFSTMSKYLIDLINQDMTHTFEREGGALGIEDLYTKRPDAVDSAIRYAIDQFERFKFNESVLAFPDQNVYEHLHEKLEAALKARTQKPFTSIVCHPSLTKMIQPLAEKFWLRVRENPMEIMKSHVLLLAGSHVTIFSVMKSQFMKKILGTEDEIYFFDERLIDTAKVTKEEVKASAPPPSGRKLRVREIHLEDESQVFYVQEDLGMTTKPSTMNANPDGTVSISYAEDWRDVKEFTTLRAAMRHKETLLGEKPKVVKEVIH